MAEARRHSKGTETVLQGLEVILQTWRLGDNFCGAYGASALPPSLVSGWNIESYQLQRRLYGIFTVFFF